MDRSKLRVIVGGAGSLARSDRMEFASAFATDSLLMGVLVVYMQWVVMPDGGDGRVPESLHQYFYIETQDIGIESYRSVRGDDEATRTEVEQSMLGSLGSGRVDLSERDAILLLQRYARVNTEKGEPLPDGFGEYGFVLNRKLEADPVEFDLLLARVCAPIENENELINYFLMRYFAGDEDAVRFLSSFELPEELSPKQYDETLCQNRIRVHEEPGAATSYVSESLIETEREHRIVVSEATLEDGKVASFRIISDFQISNAETAMKLERPEFITVYDVFIDPETLMDFLDEHYPAAMRRDTEAGRLYLSFHTNNDHVRKDFYRLNDDVSGMVYVTDEAQLILGTYSLAEIHKLERDLQHWPFGRQLLPIAKYEFKEDVLYDFLGTDLGDFVNYVETLCEFDPDGER